MLRMRSSAFDLVLSSKIGSGPLGEALYFTGWFPLLYGSGIRGWLTFLCLVTVHAHSEPPPAPTLSRNSAFRNLLQLIQVIQSVGKSARKSDASLLQAETFPLNRCGSPHKERVSAHSSLLYLCYGPPCCEISHLIHGSGSIGFLEDLSLLHYSNHGIR